MTTLSITGAAKRFGDTPVLRDVSIDVADGEFAVIVGPSGCGKSTLLRAVAGLEQLDAGSIVIDGREVGDLPPSQRGIAMVFQSYALYPHLSVYENMAFGLRIARQGNAEIDAAVRRAADILHIGDLLNRKPAALSGGQRQRVAIGRAIVRQPRIFLFDEPLSNLDADLRVHMRYEFAELHRTLGITTLYVTHDQVEAMTLADRIVLLRAGQVEQAGAPGDLYARPANLEVARFLGTPRMNILPATVAGGRATLAGGQSVPLPAGAVRLSDGMAVSLGIRPEDVMPGEGPGALRLTIGFIERLGSHVALHLRAAGIDTAIVAQLRDAAGLVEGDTLAVRFPPPRLHLFDQQGKRIEMAGGE